MSFNFMAAHDNELEHEMRVVVSNLILKFESIVMC